MAKIIYVINPNSLVAVTQRLDQAIETMRSPNGPVIRCVTLENGPRGIQSQQDVDLAACLTGDRVVACEQEALRQDNIAAAFVIACFSDPGLFHARERTRVPVFGIAESGFLTAMSRGLKVGVLSILSASIPRHWRYFASMSVTDRLAGDLAVDLSVEALESNPQAWGHLIETGRQLIDKYGADVLLLGCAGMTPFRASLERELSVPVVDPTIAAVAMALGAVEVAH
jgi:Asp/Glu/hydantoin racemase